MLGLEMDQLTSQSKSYLCKNLYQIGQSFAAALISNCQTFFPENYSLISLFWHPQDTITVFSIFTDNR
jgi:hypothetical protein